MDKTFSWEVFTILTVSLLEYIMLSVNKIKITQFILKENVTLI